MNSSHLSTKYLQTTQVNFKLIKFLLKINLISAD